MPKLASEFEADCPCCNAKLVIDANLRRVVSHRAPEREDMPELGNAQGILEEEAARREEMFRRSVSDEKGRSDALSKRFEEALNQVRDEPITRPVRDFDLD